VVITTSLNESELVDENGVTLPSWSVVSPLSLEESWLLIQVTDS
jgi:hypothetical protein